MNISWQWSDLVLNSFGVSVYTPNIKEPIPTTAYHTFLIIWVMKIKYSIKQFAMVDSFFSSPFCLKMYQYFKEKFIIGHSSEWKGYLIDNLPLEVEIFWGDSSQNMKTDCVEHVLTHGLYSLRSALQLRVSQNLSNNNNYSEKGNIMWSQEELRPKYVKIQIHQVDWTHFWDQLKWTVIRKLTIWVYYHHAMVKMDILFPLTKTYFVSSFTRYFLGCLLKNFKLPIFQLI